MRDYSWLIIGKEYELHIWSHKERLRYSWERFVTVRGRYVGRRRFSIFGWVPHFRITKIVEPRNRKGYLNRAISIINVISIVGHNKWD